jgi:hypothetical protein
MMRPEKDRNYDEMRNPDRNLEAGCANACTPE